MMPDYRAYFVDDDHTVGPPFVLTCENDEAAIAQARAIVKDLDIELWQLDGLVIRLRRPTGSRTKVSLNLRRTVRK